MPPGCTEALSAEEMTPQTPAAAMTCSPLTISYAKQTPADPLALHVHEARA